MLIDTYHFRTARIAEIVREAPRAVSIRLTTNDSYTFRVGQHAIIRVTMPDGTTLVRQYSFSAPSHGHTVWLTIVEQEAGLVSNWFNRHAKLGDTIELSQPFTGPLVQKIPRGEICIIAGGSGIAPLIAWVRVLRAKNKPFTLFYSTRSDEMCFADELRPTLQENSIIRLTDTTLRLSRDEIIAKLTPQSTVFICGSRPFVTTMREYCETIVPNEHIFSEAFTL